MAEFTRHCLCGGSVNAEGALDLVEGIAKSFRDLHQGEGHGQATARQASAARRRDWERIARASLPSSSVDEGNTHDE